MNRQSAYNVATCSMALLDWSENEKALIEAPGTVSSALWVHKPKSFFLPAPCPGIVERCLPSREVVRQGCRRHRAAAAALTRGLVGLRSHHPGQ